MAEACIGGAISNATSAGVNSQCAAHYSGTGATFRGRNSSRFVERVNLKCTRCAHGYFKDPSGRCAPCGSTTRQTVGVLLLAVALIAALGTVLFGAGAVVAALCVSPALVVLAVLLMLLWVPRLLCLAMVVSLFPGYLPPCSLSG